MMCPRVKSEDPDTESTYGKIFVELFQKRLFEVESHEKMSKCLQESKRA